MSEHRKFLKSAGIMGVFTLMSRILGFIRDIIIAKLFGTGMAAQAFVVAFRIPNTLRDLVGEGATNAAVIPVMSEYLNKDKKEFWHLANVLLNIFVVVLAVITVAGIVFAPLIVRMIAFGFVDSPEKMLLTVHLTRVIFSFIFFIGLAAYAMGVLNTLKHFTLPAIGPCLLNITMIVFGLWLCKYFQEPIMGMAVAVLIGGFLQLIVQVPVLIRLGFRGELSWKFRHPAVKRIGILLLPRIIGSSIYQLNVFVDTMFASMSVVVGEGAIAALYYANRLIAFPTAIFGVSLASASLPTLSRQAIANDLPGIKNTLAMSLRTLLVLLIPSTVGLCVLAQPITSVLFQRGKFDAASTQITALALVFYCLGIFAYSGARVMTSCFYALKDTRTPVKVAFLCMLINAILNFILMRPLKVGGIALATSISSSANFFILVAILRARIGLLGFRKVLSTFFPVALASAVMAGTCLFTYRYFHCLKGWLALLLSLVIGTAVYLIACWLLGVFKGIPVKLWKR